MQRKAYVPGIAALLAALLAGCTGSSDDGGTTDGSNPGDTGTASPAAEPGRYRTLPEPCTAVGESMLDELLPGLRQITDGEQREKAYEGEPTVTFDTDRKVGCQWKVDGPQATDHLLIDFERVVSYDNSVSDDNQAEQLFAEREAAAHLPEPTATESATSESPAAGSTPAGGSSAAPSDSPGSTSSPSSPSSPSGSSSPSATPTELQPRVLEDFGDEAFIDDELSSSGSTAKQRTVTVAFRTSNVIVTIEYVEQPATVGVVPDSKELQDRAQKLASQLADSLSD
ncbi:MULTISPECIES: DUF3558 domain-containing protein [Streptomyces]|uniref:DUF3558 domain-containing protein n=1 Tax=Streptomyces koelreuteriae TaxID=2838015 RepID=A0ABX8FRW2_9ACTN|nr:MULTISPECIES: DUF3558 domain-containing protein [Streptomyces]QWB23876.1 DUF3558 domain-containing protein [Streptomyces koelreuteriae]UUA06858.1 DUF3558 domain-containing protein [Streptomyces koelreuteriae]UUA14487.1 DUF3558 domain-containing protein [Streptomyces sp. CRCS-T-1]